MSIQLKRSLEANIDTDYVLAQGQIGINMRNGTNQLWVDNWPFDAKIGDGVNKWSDLYSIFDFQTWYKSYHYNNYDYTSSGGFNPFVQVHQTSVNLYCGHLADSYKLPGGFRISAYCYTKSETYPKTEHLYFEQTASASSSTTYSMSLYPRRYDTTDIINIGKSDTQYRFNTIYATAALNTSDASVKSDVRYISDAEAAIASADSAEVSNIVSLGDVLEFVNEINPVTYVYNDSGFQTVPDALDAGHPECVQYGLIADEIENSKLFKFIGCRDTWEETPEVKDDAGEILQEYSPAGSILSLKPLALTCVALTACKYLLQRVDMLESKVLS